VQEDVRTLVCEHVELPAHVAFGRLDDAQGGPRAAVQVLADACPRTPHSAFRASLMETLLEADLVRRAFEGRE
jgi:hypothetical protein